MLKYIPDELYGDTKNRKKVSKILDSVPDTCIRFPGLKTLEDAIAEINAIGEDKVADFLLH